MELTKKYRLIYKDNQIISLGKYDVSSVTGVGDGMNYYESNIKQNVIDKINNLNLITENNFDFEEFLKEE